LFLGPLVAPAVRKRAEIDGVAGSEFADRVERLIAPSLADMGYTVVRILMTGQQRPTLQIMAERSDGRGMTVDDCAEISRVVSALLDVEDPVRGAYTLEVSSPGIDRPLVKPGDFARFAGHVARVETRMPIDGRRRFRGTLVATTERGVRMGVEGAEVELPFDAIEKAKLVITDALIAETMKQAESARK
jgi:ribosome maturation factor RimP